MLLACHFYSMSTSDKPRAWHVTAMVLAQLFQLVSSALFYNFSDCDCIGKYGQHQRAANWAWKMK